MRKLTLAVVGIDLSTADRSKRQSGAKKPLPGAPIKLALECKNKHDPYTIAVSGAQDVQFRHANARVRCTTACG